MARNSKQLFASVRTEGLLLPPELLQRVADLDTELPGLAPGNYHLAEGERINDATNRAWNRMMGLWARLRKDLDNLVEGEAATGPTRERWLLPLFQELGYGRLPKQRTIELEERSFPISHMWDVTPVHLVGVGIDIDKRTRGQAGAATSSPHSLVQEFLNRSDDHLWGFVANGLKLRILRDNLSLTRQAYVEFDLAAMMDGELYSDFRLLYLLCHQSRVEGDRPEECYLEQWFAEAKKQGTRVLEQLREGVEQCIAALGSGFLLHPANTALQVRLQSGELDTQEYYRQLLRMVYRLIFLFVSEDRELLLSPDADDVAKQRYVDYYSTARLRRLAGKLRGGRHDDLYESLKFVMSKLHESSCPELGLPALGSLLWDPESIEDLANSRISNADLLTAVRALATARHDGALRPVDFRNLGPEELGGVYESLLELHPEIHRQSGTFVLGTAAGHERKTTGSYYTPESLVQCLLDSALDPVMNEAVKAKAGEEAADALLALKICDPAVGSGHFLIAAAHRMARRVASARTGELEPSPDAVRTALRDVIGRCLYGVDMNPMAAEICKVSLWLEALEPGKPLSFLDHHIRVGNALFGVSPDLLDQGVPDDAFKYIEGDDRAICNALKARNKRERESGQRDLLTSMVAEDSTRNTVAADFATEMRSFSDATLASVTRKAEKYKTFFCSEDYLIPKLQADGWCAAFVQMKDCVDKAVTTASLEDLVGNNVEISPSVSSKIQTLAQEFQFFHWHLEFPEVFASDGFDCILGNPPWERTAFELVPFFSGKCEEIVKAETTASRNQLIDDLRVTDPQLWVEYQRISRHHKARDFFYAKSGVYPFSSSGRTNTFALFGELAFRMISKSGCIGMVLPSALATDTPYAAFWGEIISNRGLVSMFDFENRGEHFTEVHRSYKFSLFVFRSSRHEAPSKFGFFLDSASETHLPDKIFEIPQSDVASINPLTKLLPVCRSIRDFALLTHLHKASGLLMEEAMPWVGFTSAATSAHWELNAEERWPKESEAFLWEAKCIHQFDHRYATYEETSPDDKINGKPNKVVLNKKGLGDKSLMRYIVPKLICEEHLRRKQAYISGCIGYRDVARSTDERTMIASLIPLAGLMQPLNGVSSTKKDQLLELLACLNSFALDYCCKQKTPGTHVNVTICKQLPVIIGENLSKKSSFLGVAGGDWIKDRVCELVYTSSDLNDLMTDLGVKSGPFVWNEERRFWIRCELDALFFHLYCSSDGIGNWSAEGEVPMGKGEGIKTYFPVPRDAVSYILDCFPITRRRDEEKYGGIYRTKQVILERFDAMQEAISTGQPYESPLIPAPADPSLCDSPRDSTDAA